MIELKDFYRWQIYNSNDKLAFAIEPEIQADFLEKLDYNDYKHESSTILELLWVHNQNEETRLKLHDLIKKEYKNKFPNWSDKKISWGTHFVLFWDFRDLYYKYNEIMYKILNCPLHLKTKDWVFYSRELNYRRAFCIRDNLEYNSKSLFCSLKDELYSNDIYEIDWCPIEFRCNNVFDERILWYYQWIILAVEKDIKFKKMSDWFREYAKTWDTNYYYTKNVSFKEMNWYKISDIDLKNLKTNIRKIIKLLKAEWLENSAKQLKEYINERWIIIK